MSANQTFREILDIEALLGDAAASKGRVTSLKAAHRKLSRLYLDQRAAEQVA